MKKILLTIIFSLLILKTFGQTKMHPLNELINTEDPGWSLVEEWIQSAKNKVEILQTDKLKAEDALYKMQVTTRSPMGSIVYMTGGILIDDGWIRILGSGSDRLNRSLPDWNKGKTITDFGQPTPYLLIADDAIGGFFMLNGGGLGNDIGKVYYFAPDNLEFEPLDLTYSEFLSFCFNNDLNEFYEDYRWKNWKSDVKKLKGDNVYSFYPYLWTKEGKYINNNSKKEISCEEQYSLNLDFRRQLGIDKKR